MSPKDEDSLVRRAQKGDREAFGMLFEVLTPKLFGYLVNTLRNRTLAEDILQTTWLKAIEGLPRIKKRRVKMSAWLFQVARNECRMHWRRFGRETPLGLPEHDVPGGDGQDLETAIFARQILSLISEEDREILSLRYIADLTTNDIAGVLNLNLVAARVRIHRAVGRARKAFTSKTQ